MLTRRSEQYVRPPVLAREPASPTLVRWRFRAVSAVLLALFGLLVLMLFLKLSGVTAEDPGLGVGSDGLPPAVQVTVLVTGAAGR